MPTLAGIESVVTVLADRLRTSVTLDAGGQVVARLGRVGPIPAGHEMMGRTDAVLRVAILTEDRQFLMELFGVGGSVGIVTLHTEAVADRLVN